MKYSGTSGNQPATREDELGSSLSSGACSSLWLTDTEGDPRGVECAVQQGPVEVAARDEDNRIELDNGHPWYVVQVWRVRERVADKERGRGVVHQQ